MIVSPARAPAAFRRHRWTVTCRLPPGASIAGSCTVDRERGAVGSGDRQGRQRQLGGAAIVHRAICVGAGLATSAPRSGSPLGRGCGSNLWRPLPPGRRRQTAVPAAPAMDVPAPPDARGPGAAASAAAAPGATCAAASATCAATAASAAGATAGPPRRRYLRLRPNRCCRSRLRLNRRLHSCLPCRRSPSRRRSHSSCCWPGRTSREQRQEQIPAPDRWTTILAQLHDCNGSPLMAGETERLGRQGEHVANREASRGGAGAIGDLQRAQVRLIVHPSQRSASTGAPPARQEARLFDEADGVGERERRSRASRGDDRAGTCRSHRREGSSVVR